jgi:hypothetical protein
MDVKLSSCAWGSGSAHAGLANVAGLGLLVNNTSNLTTGTFIPNYNIYGGATMSLSWNSSNGTITVTNLNAGLMAYLASTGLNATNTPLYFTIAATDPSILPVIINSFNVTPVANRYASIQWSVAQQGNIQSYIIQRSLDGSNWNDLQIVMPRIDNASAINYYNETDQSPIAGISFYRIKVLDFLGNAIYSDVEKIAIELSQFSIGNISPNPFQESITLNVLLPDAGNISIKLVNAYGYILKTINVQANSGTNNIVMNGLSALSSGLYFIEINDKNQNMARKLLKIK